MARLGKLLKQEWLLTALDSYLVTIDDSLRGEPKLLHASWMAGKEEDIYQSYLGSIGLSQKESKPIPPRTRRLFDDGFDMQRRYIRYFREMGILFEPEGWDEDRGVRYIDADYGIIGHVDCLVWVPTPEGQILVPVELKARNDQRFKKARHWPEFNDYHQLQMYIYMSQAPWGYIAPENKNDQDFQPKRIPKNDKVINTALTKAANVWNRIAEELT